MKKSSDRYFVLAGLSLSEEVGFICFTESPLKTMNNAFDFILKAQILLSDVLL